jgi:MFS family permease
VTSGFVMVALARLATDQGISVSEVATLVGVTLLPQTPKFFWAPLTDMIWTCKRWYVAASIASSLTVALMGFVPIRHETLFLLEVLVFINSFASTFLGMSVEAIMAHATPEAERGRAAGWLQAGNLGGSGIGGGVALWLILNLPRPWMGTSLVGALLFACSAALVRVPEPPKEEGTLWARMKGVFWDVVSVIGSRNGVLVVAVCFLPMGAGAAVGLFAAVSKEWQASVGMVEGLNGWGSGLVGIIGCLVGGRFSDAMNRKAAYAIGGAVLALFASAMAFVPQNPTTYAALCIGYAFVASACYGAFTGLVLEAIGAGAAATKYNAFASLSNIPILYMTKVDGWAADKWGSAKMLLVDAAAGAAGIVVLLGVVALVASRRPAPAPQGV